MRFLGPSEETAVDSLRRALPEHVKLYSDILHSELGAGAYASGEFGLDNDVNPFLELAHTDPLLHLVLFVWTVLVPVLGLTAAGLFALERLVASALKSKHFFNHKVLKWFVRLH